MKNFFSFVVVFMVVVFVVVLIIFLLSKVLFMIYDRTHCLGNTKKIYKKNQRSKNPVIWEKISARFSLNIFKVAGYIFSAIKIVFPQRFLFENCEKFMVRYFQYCCISIGKLCLGGKLHVGMQFVWVCLIKLRQ